MTKAKQNTRRRHGEGSIAFDAKRQLYVAQITRDGKRHTVSAKLERDCMKKLDALKADLRRGAVITKQVGLTVGDILDHWISVSLPNDEFSDDRAPGTLTNQRAYVRRLKSVIGHRPIAKLTVDDIEQAYRTIMLRSDRPTVKGKKPTPTRVNYLVVIRSALVRAVKDAERRRVVSDTVVRIVEAAQIPRSLAAAPGERRALTIDEMRALLEATSAHRLHASVHHRAVDWSATW